MAKHV
jgi:hypothetical protein